MKRRPPGIAGAAILLALAPLLFAALVIVGTACDLLERTRRRPAPKKPTA